MGAVLALYRQPNKPSLSACARKVARDTGVDWRSLKDRAQRYKSKLPRQTFYGGRNTAAALKALLSFRRRDYLSLCPNDVWTGDGHAMKFKVAHPETGSPFVPEVTLIMDVATRYVVGYSVSYSENVIAVSDALRHGIETSGMPLIYYSDNGAGQKNRTFDAPVTGILGALRIQHETGIPGNPQGRGVIERAWQTITIPLAREFPTYRGHGADRDTLKNVMRGITKSLRAARSAGGGDVVSLPRTLPTMKIFIEALKRAIHDYNHLHEHSSLPKINGTHATPATWRAHRIAETGADNIVMLPREDIAALFKPSVTRRAARGEVRWLNGIYFHRDLMLVDDETVKVHYDMHDESRVWVHKISGEFIAEAALNGNRSSYFPQPMIERLRDQREERRVALKQSQIDEIRAERTSGALTDQTTGQPLVPLVFDDPAPALVDNVVSLPTAERTRPMFDSDAEMYRWLKANPADVTAFDRGWIEDYRRTREYQDLFAEREARDQGNEREVAAG